MYPKSTIQLLLLLLFCFSLKFVDADSDSNNPFADLLPFASNKLFFKPFRGIPAAFGYLNLDKRTDIVVIGDDGTRVDIYYQEKHVANFTKGFSCKCDKKIAQVYLTDVNSSARPKLILLLIEKVNGKTEYHLNGLAFDTLDGNLDGFGPPKLDSNSVYTIEAPAALTSISAQTATTANHFNSTSSLPLAKNDRPCNLEDLNVVLLTQPLLFDLDGDLQTDFMGVDVLGNVSVWVAPKRDSKSKKFERREPDRWKKISADYFKAPHSNSFIDMDSNGAADIVLSSNSKFAYAFSEPNPEKSFTGHMKKFPQYEKNLHYGQSALVDVNADGIIDHILPRCNDQGLCQIVVLYNNSKEESIFKFQNYYPEKINFAEDYEFPISLRPGDLDGDGYTDFVTVARNNSGHHSVLYLRNIKAPDETSHTIHMRRTFQVIDIPVDIPLSHEVKIAIPFDIDEDGKMDLLIGSSSKTSEKPGDMLVSAKINTQILDSFFMKVLVTNGHGGSDSASNEVGHSAIGPFVCFELYQNTGEVMKGCAGQMAQSSHFSLQLPYTIFGLGQTPHFVEKLNVSIPGYSKGEEPRVRMRVFEQIVPDAQVIIIPNEPENPSNWGHRLFLSPMSQLALSTGIALAVIGLVLLVIIAILHRKDSQEDAAEHEEYKRHWPESR